MAIAKGYEAVVKVGSDTLGQVTDFSFNKTVDSVETSSIGTTSKSFVNTLESWSGSVNLFFDDADTAVDTVQVPFRFYPCLAAGLAYYIALKKSPERVQLLKGLYEEEFVRAAEEDRDKASLNLVPSYTFVSAVS